ncbi:hypothetical protein [Cellulomonas sp. NTE-D12]|uniref:hypothetical protein n=1 Tax=Cellulomonas sp. NTE-D12 TaxID=2962632 RepID=UPI003081A35D|nr:hypothetical protein CELD12_04880 [Cellulomonas sp. NTE-D12]
MIRRVGRRGVVAAVALLVVGPSLAACSATPPRPTALQADALAVSQAAAAHDLAATTAATGRLNADVVAARQSGTLDAARAATIESAAAAVLADVTAAVQPPATTAASPSAPPPARAPAPAHQPKGKGKGGGD